MVFILIIFAAVFLSTAPVYCSYDKENGRELYRQMELFSDALAIIENEYVEETKPKDLIYGSLGGMLSSLDQHSQFLDPDAYSELKVDTQGKFGGIGIEITVRDGLLTVITPIEDTPAWKAGLKPLDRIVKIDNELAREMTLNEAVKKMRGRPGDAVSLSVLREGKDKLLELRIIRDIIRIKDIKSSRMLEPGIGYIRLTEFREGTQKNLEAALYKLQKDKMSALILDLRNNPGGLLESAVGVVGKFIPKGKLVVYIKGRKEGQDAQFFSKDSHPLPDLPLAVLINEGSASGSEIVAACLQDYKRAVIVGAKSFGKGSVQSVIPLSDGSALKLTTSKYFSPFAKEIQGKGVIPDLLVEEPLSKEDDDIRLRVKRDTDFKSDRQLVRALEHLKENRKI
jgi:carboxyl-terminal processing protease